MMSKNKKIYRIVLLLTLLFWSCANPQPPSGGPPDKEPPTIIGTEPSQNAINFTGNEIEFSFNEYLNRQKVRESIYIFPEIPFELSWSGKSFNVQFTEGLQPNTTYSIALGTDYTDMSGNKPTDGYNLIFSTGTSIDSGKISGRVIGDSVGGAFVFLYKIDDVNKDSINPAVIPVKYKSQVGEKGNFSLAALPWGKYRAFAVRDEYKDNLYDSTTDVIGCATADFYLDSTQNNRVINILLPTKSDKSKPDVLTVQPLSKNRGYCKFTKAIVIDSSFTLKLQDSAETQSVQEVLIKYADAKNPALMYFETTFDLNTYPVWKYTLSGFRDTLGITSGDSLYSGYFYAPEEIADTVPIRVEVSTLPDSSEIYTSELSIELRTNRALNPLKFIEGLRLRDTSGRDIPAEAYLRSPNAIVIEPNAEIASGIMYELLVNQEYLQAQNTITPLEKKIKRYRFTQFDKIRGGAMQGSIVDTKSDSSTRYIVEFLHYEKEKRSAIPPFSIVVQRAGTWSIEGLPSGDYHIRAFTDVNNDGKLFNGIPYPFKPSAKLFKTQKPISVKSRWTVENVTIIFED